MSEYQLELKQLVDYPRCRIYREFIQSLIKESSIRVSRHAGLFHYAVLCCYANFRTSYKRIDGISYTIRPGEWICRISEVLSWFRLHFKHQLTALLDELQARHLITYTFLGRGKLVKFSIQNWHRFNRVLDYNAPCQKESGFFFLPIATANELISYARCSEMDVMLDLWINTIYNDHQVQGSEKGPVVYLRNGTGSPLVSYAELAQRWGLSKSTVGRYLQKLRDMELIELFTFAGTHGTAIYLRNYLSTMFEISDVLLDKDEIAMSLNIKVVLSAEDAMEADLAEAVSVSESLSTVSKKHIAAILPKVKKLLEAQGFSCVSCPSIQYKLLPLSDECRGADFLHSSKVLLPILHCLLTLSCRDGQELCLFEIRLTEGGSL